MLDLKILAVYSGCLLVLGGIRGKNLPNYYTLVIILSIMQDNENQNLDQDQTDKKLPDSDMPQGSYGSSEYHSDQQPHIDSQRDKDTYSHDPSPTVASAHIVAPVAAKSSSGGIIVLQWLTYAFWGWTLLAVNWLIYIVIDSLLTGDDLSSFIPYSIAATLVLLPISVVTDLFYGKHEPVKKTGASMVVMIIHAVIFALFAIGSLITCVFIFVQMAIQTLSNPAVMNAWLLTFLASAVLYGFTFLRTLNPSPKLKLKKIFPFGMLLIVAVFTVMAFVGPYAKSIVTRNDRDIMSGLTFVSDGVSNYVSKNNKLPTSLNDITIDQEQGKVIVQKGLVTYKPEGKSLTSDTNYNDSSSGASTSVGYDYKYQLCVVYTEKGGESSTYSSDSINKDQYNSSAYIYSHPAGSVCYKLKSTVFENSTTTSNTDAASLFGQ